ncbi:MAG: hypothetical protein H7Z41_09325 [Cytophagales bacterium]|nr:hypothetical protein [Armatimonadota bacterium]
MSTAPASVLTTGGVDPDERIVEEVHCIECGVPISAIPSWYANVNVRFTCDTCRQKSPRLGQPVAAADSDGPRSTDGAIGLDADPDLAIDDAEIDDAELGVDDTEAEAEAEEE